MSSISAEDAFQGITKTTIQNILGKIISDNEYLLVIHYLKFKVIKLLKDILITSIMKRDTTSLLEIITRYKINTDKIFPLDISKKILIKIVQDKLQHYGNVHNSEVYKDINQLFGSILYYVVSQYLIKIKDSDFSKFNSEFLEIYSTITLENQMKIFDLKLPNKPTDKVGLIKYKNELIMILRYFCGC